MIKIGTFAHPLLQLAWSGSISTECSWYGITCDTNKEHVIKLTLFPDLEETVNFSTPETAQFPFLENIFYDNHCSTPNHCFSEVKRLALENIYAYSIVNKTKLNWFTPNVSECNWDGIVCEEQGNHIVKLSLSFLNIKNLASERGSFSKLTELDLSYNALNSLPSGIKQLTKLKTLRLGSNKLNTFPLGINQLLDLDVLSIHSNQLSSIPTSIDIKGRCNTNHKR